MSKTGMPCVPWSAEHLADLVLRFATTENRQLAERYGRTVQGLKHAARKLGLTKNAAWMHSERARIGKENQQAKGWKENHISALRMMKPGRTQTQFGYQDVEERPGVRYITHTLSDSSRRSA